MKKYHINFFFRQYRPALLLTKPGERERKKQKNNHHKQEQQQQQQNYKLTHSWTVYY